MNVKPEGGSGGKRGHSNMDHRDRTAQVKATTRKARRRIGKTLATETD